MFLSVFITEDCYTLLAPGVFLKIQKSNSKLRTNFQRCVILSNFTCPKAAREPPSRPIREPSFRPIITSRFQTGNTWLYIFCANHLLISTGAFVTYGSARYTCTFISGAQSTAPPTRIHEVSIPFHGILLFAFLSEKRLQVSLYSSNFSICRPGRYRSACQPGTHTGFLRDR